MNLKEILKEIDDCDYLEDQDLSGYTTMRLGSVGNVLECKSLKAVQEVLPLLKQFNKKYIVVGWGANQILPPICDELILHLNFSFDLDYFKEPRSEYEIPASLGLNHLTSHAAKFGLKGWEVFTGIPASLGGAIFMNAGTNLGEIGDLVKEVTLIRPDGMIRKQIIDKNCFSYRKNHFVQQGEVIVGATLTHHGIDKDISQKIKEYLDYRKTSQPLATKNCGCVFKNPSKDMQAGRLIDEMGLKGLQVGGLRISPKHANFIENTGGGTWEDFKALLGIIQTNLKQRHGIEFELEVKIPYD